MKNIHAISIVDSNSLFCEGLKRIIDRRCFRIADVWPNIEEAVKAGQTGASPAVILVNAAGRALPTDEILSRLRETFPGARLVLIAETCDPARIQKAVQAEIDGFLLETIRPDAFSKVLELIVIGERIFPVTQQEQGKEGRGETAEAAGPASEAGSALEACSAFEKVSAGEMRVVALLADACPNKIIARELGISESTVKVHVKAILRKTGARNRTDIALLAQSVGAGNNPNVRTAERPSHAAMSLNKALAADERPGEPALWIDVAEPGGDEHVLDCESSTASTRSVA